jgi:hypothetical protein
MGICKLIPSYMVAVYLPELPNSVLFMPFLRCVICDCHYAQYERAFLIQQCDTAHKSADLHLCGVALTKIDLGSTLPLDRYISVGSVPSRRSV